MCLANKLHTATTTSLLDSLHDESNQDVWIGFDARYRPIILGLARRLGLPPEDAADVAQETLAEFIRDYRRGRYQRGKGRLRTWIMAIARNRAIDLIRARARSRSLRVSVEVDDTPSDEAVESAWDAEEERAIFRAAHQELCETTRADPITLRVFELTAMQGLSNDAAAKACGLSSEQVRLAKHRMTTRLREIVDRIAEAYRTDE